MKAKINEMVLALLCLTTFHDGNEMGSWKSQDWANMERLHQADHISNPQSKAKLVGLSDKGAKKSKALFEQHFLNRSS